MPMAIAADGEKIMTTPIAMEAMKMTSMTATAGAMEAAVTTTATKLTKMLEATAYMEN